MPVEEVRENFPNVQVQVKLPRLLQQYKKILKEAASQGYRVVSVKEWHQRPELEDSTKIIVMRHDVDFDDLYAKALAYIEHKQGFHSTYYFRWSTANPEVIDYIKSLGHEVGLHYETLATYAIEKGIYSRYDLSEDIFDICRQKLKNEISLFESLYGDIYSISSHGEDRNRILGVPNVVLTKGQNLVDFGVVVDGSHLELLRDQVFVADSGGKWYPYSVDQAIAEGPHRIYCLIHPVWWHERKNG